MPLNYQRTITDEEVKLLENDLIDIKDWIDKAIEGKINNCMKRAAKQYEEHAKINSLSTMPVKDIDKAQLLFIIPGYKKRKDKEEKK